MVTVTFCIALTGQPVEPGAEPREYVPWPDARVRFERVAGDYAPGMVRPASRVDALTDEHGRGEVILQPGRYLITLPSSEGFACVLGDDVGDTIDLSLLLAGGVEPTDPRYATITSYVDERIEAIGLSPVHVGATPPAAPPWPMWWVKPGGPGDPAQLYYHAGSGEYLLIGGGGIIPDPDPPAGALYPGATLYPGADLFPTADDDDNEAAVYPNAATYPNGALYPSGG